MAVAIGIGIRTRRPADGLLEAFLQSTANPIAIPIPIPAAITE